MMEEDTLFKCKVFWKGETEVRRFGIEKSKATTFDVLDKKLQAIIPGLALKKYKITWTDNDGDEVTISTDGELKIAVAAMPDLVRLKVYCDNTLNTTEAADSAAAANNSTAHYGVVCDGCDNVVCGFRYKCTICDDYDLCSKCEAASLHPEHCMVRVPEPNMSHSILKASVKRSRHFLKTVASAPEDERCKKSRDPNSEHKRRGEHGHGHNNFHGHGHRQRSGDHDGNQRPYTGWLGTFATYMNEFANLAGDANIGFDKSEPKRTQTQATQSPKEPKSTANIRMSCHSTPENMDLNKIQEIIKVYIESLDPTKPCDSKAASETSSSKNNDEELGQGDGKSSESDKESFKSEVSCSESESVKNDISEKIDDWTVINKERDLMDTDEKPNDPTPPIGFNLPEEFQDCVNISGGSLYPELNAATAVLKLKELEVRAAVPGTSTDKAQPSAPPTNVPKAEPRKRHPLRHIDAAIDQMLAMGFTNDGGWLTQLLESKNGNIAAVLDLLTPVNPKK